MLEKNLSTLIQDIISADAEDAGRQRELFRDMVRIGEQVRGYSNPDVDFMLFVATELTRHLSNGSPPSLEDIQHMVTRFLVNAECRCHRIDEERFRKGVSSIAPLQSAPQPVPLQSTGQVHVNIDVVSDPNQVPEEATQSISQPPAVLRLSNLLPGDAPVPDLRRVKLGEVLEQMGLVDSDQINNALKIQGGSKLRIGEVLNHLGQLASGELRGAIRLHAKARNYAEDRSRDVTGAEVQLPLGQWFDTLLGEILVSADAITRKELDQALSIKQATGMLMGEVLIQHGFCDNATVLQAIRLQEKLRTCGRPVFGNVSNETV
ncbi:MAG: hypothetical protein ACI8X5_003013 [Planctomycetota bacterium]|jgi:hypothetical protein